MINKNNSHSLLIKNHRRPIGIAVVLLGFFTVAIFTGPSHDAYANEFLKMPIRVHSSPTICALEPQPDAKFSNLGTQLLDKTEHAVSDWKTKLNAASGKHPVWNINLIKVPLGQQNGFDYTKCDITIHFLPKPQTKDEEFVALGLTIPNFETGKTNIEIYYLDFQPNYRMVEWFEGDQEYYTYLYEPYYTGNVATDTELSSTITHEIGHSLGLGHYIVSEDERKNIVNGMEDMPSIMIDTATILGVTHYDITQLDVSEIKSIYGDGGFDNQHLSNGNYQRTQILSTSKPSYLQDDRIKISIDTSKFTNDTFGALLIIDSSSKLDDDMAISKSNSTIYLSDKYNSEKGKYWIEYINPFTGDYDFTSFTSGAEASTSTSDMVDKTSTSDTQDNTGTSGIPDKPSTIPTPQTASVQIPVWIKTNAKWWSQGQLGDDEFVKGIQYLIQQGILKIPQTSGSSSPSHQIPQWIKNTAKWWSGGQLSDDEFIKAIQYMVSNGIIRMS
ncbi:MAG TPA: hypothetical protein VLT10_00485 [Verrucomicrobiae bacterium]|nr:hypothetical protein [Verrucomicrobiae bacterium]